MTQLDDEWTRLAAIPPAMADAVRPLLTAVTLSGYRRFLDRMVHYTRGSGARLRWAAERATTPARRGLFAELAREEAGHHRLAEADLAAFGEAPRPEPPALVRDFDASWRAGDELTWLGALFALESVAGHLGADARASLGRLGLRREQARFVLVHLDADLEHGAATAALVRAALGEAVRAAATRAAAFWVELHREALG